MRPIIVWFRRDLRVDDHAALYHASREGTPLVPLFIFDTSLIRTLSCDGAAFDIQADALAQLGAKLERLGGQLVTRRGNVLEIHKILIQELHPSALYYNRDYEPYARSRDQKVEALYRSCGIEVKSYKDTVIHEPDEVLTQKNEPFVVFTPYANAWNKLSHPLPFGKPRAFRTPPVHSEAILRARDLARATTILSPVSSGGEQEAHRRWDRFLSARIESYEKGRDIPSSDGTSRMSVALRFGCISVRRMLEDCRKAATGSSAAARDSIRKFVAELVWREFYQSVLYHFPRLLQSNYRTEFDSMPWRFSEKQFGAWKAGATGFPMVDAGMRQLNQTGWMHNRVRMVVASFLTKDLRHDWKRGASYFEEKLLDIETASNNGGWQWSASTGVDPKPLRIFNPRLQSERFDADGEYIKTYLPELRRVPGKFIHAPHTMPPALQQDLGCIIGKHYPKPILDHHSASEEYKRIYSVLKTGRRR